MALPIAMVSIDNCSHNGEKLMASILSIARAWIRNEFADSGFLQYLQDESCVTFPWSMIDKITPRPSPAVEEALVSTDIADMSPIITSKGTSISGRCRAK